MNEPVKTLMKRSISIARKYKSLDRKLVQLIDQRQRADWNDPSRNQIERQIQAVAAKMRALSGGSAE
jgi:hypothetical protein